MIILPAIDIKDGNCVRLFKGDFATVHKVAENPLETARSFEAAGAKWIHMVDLDGAKTGDTANRPIFLEVAKQTSLNVELGGGIRDMQTIAYYLENGISRVILGSVAVKQPELVREAVNAFGDKIAVGIDAMNGMVATHGWLSTSDVHFVELGKAMEDIGVQTLIFTDISRDGTLEGVSREQLSELSSAVSCDVIASGGVRDIEDIKACMQMKLYGAICGKSIYSGSLSLVDAIRMTEEPVC